MMLIQSAHPGSCRGINVELDGAVAMTVITGTSGLFSFELPADSSIARGEHQIAVKFQGEELYLPTIANSSVLVRQISTSK